MAGGSNFVMRLWHVPASNSQAGLESGGLLTTSELLEASTPLTHARAQPLLGHCHDNPLSVKDC